MDLAKFVDTITVYKGGVVCRLRNHYNRQVWIVFNGLKLNWITKEFYADARKTTIFDNEADVIDAVSKLGSSQYTCDADGWKWEIYGG